MSGQADVSESVCVRVSRSHIVNLYYLLFCHTHTHTHTFLFEFSIIYLIKSIHHERKMRLSTNKKGKPPKKCYNKRFDFLYT